MAECPLRQYSRERGAEFCPDRDGKNRQELEQLDQQYCLANPMDCKRQYNGLDLILKEIKFREILKN